MTDRFSRLIPLTILALILGVLIALIAVSDVKAECEPTPITEYTPTGIKGCSVFGAGLASWWQGPGVARNDCVYPWRACQAIRITSLDSGLSITVTPTMYGDLFTGTSDQRIVDLDPSSLKALGLWEARTQGLFRVTVQPIQSQSLPDTALPPSG